MKGESGGVYILWKRWGEKGTEGTIPLGSPWGEAPCKTGRDGSVDIWG